MKLDASEFSPTVLPITTRCVTTPLNPQNAPMPTSSRSPVSANMNTIMTIIAVLSYSVSMFTL